MIEPDKTLPAHFVTMDVDGCSMSTVPCVLKKGQNTTVKVTFKTGKYLEAIVYMRVV